MALTRLPWFGTSSRSPLATPRRATAGGWRGSASAAGGRWDSVHVACWRAALAAVDLDKALACSAVWVAGVPVRSFRRRREPERRRPQHLPRAGLGDRR